MLLHGILPFTFRPRATLRPFTTEKESRQETEPSANVAAKLAVVRQTVYPSSREPAVPPLRLVFSLCRFLPPRAMAKLLEGNVSDLTHRVTGRSLAPKALHHI